MEKKTVQKVGEYLEGSGEYSLQVVKWYLNSIGIWPPSQSSSMCQRSVSRVLNILCYFFILFTVIPCIIFLCLEPETFYTKLKVTGPLSHWFVGGINYTTLLMKGSAIRECIEHVKTDWTIITRSDARQVMTKNAKIGHYVAAFCAVFMQGGVLCWCVASGFTKIDIQIGNETKTIRTLPCTVYMKLLPVDTNPTYGIVLASQFVSGFIVNQSTICAFSLATVFAAHAHGQLTIMMSLIIEFVNQFKDQNSNDAFTEIGVIVEHHLRVLSFIDRIEDVMTRICFTELFKCTLDMCILGYYILMEWADHDVRALSSYVVILISMIFNIFTICYIGEILTEQCQKIGEAVYLTDWYNLPEKHILDLILIISRSSVPPDITAGKMAHMSIYTFGSVIRSAVAYLNLFRQLYVNFRLVTVTMTITLTNPWDRDWTYSLQMNRWILKSIGVWPIALYETTPEKINSVILACISTFLISFLLVPCALCTLLDKTGDLDAKIKMIGPLSFCVMAAIKYYILVSRGAEIAKCLGMMRDDWARIYLQQNQEEKETMRENARFGRSLAVFCAVFMYSGGFFYTTVMPLCTKRTEIIDNETVRSQAFPIYRGLLDPRTSPSFEIVQLMQCLSGFVIYSVTVGACGLAAVFVMHVCGQFKIIEIKLNKLVDRTIVEKQRDTHGDRLGDIVEYHIQILGFISQIEELLNEICFVEFVGCSMNICFLGYYLLTEWEQNEPIGTLTYCTLLISFTFNIFILCYIGEILSEQCKELSLSAYMIDWYRIPGKQALGLILLFAMSNSTMKLTAGKLVELSLGNFCDMLKSSLAYLSLLRTLTT
ncbi:uncharacterized protein LOC108624258 [Ceratina calcarata]|uniref:Uncharacterized protein LOC108624258 n=1 Tax=Ceratina calcarata TaxID=156304 RepID=A0AAJ7N5R7_9HYME|nr:uncharacterized protein LOC108624258 [Ceratina calcarata]